MAGKGILLESGTNELEVLEFIVGEQHYGINVAKIQELTPYTPPTLVPNSHTYIEGIYMARDTIITVVDLSMVLGITERRFFQDKEMYVITNFNKLNIAFHVQATAGIHRVSWADIEGPEACQGLVGCERAVGFVKIQGRPVVMLDFEYIISEINSQSGLKTEDVVEASEGVHYDSPILLAEDSPLLRSQLKDCLNRSGFNNLTFVEDGQSAWEYIEKTVAEQGIGKGISLVVTDIEMPRMDGYHLLKRIKDDSRYTGLPVVIFSSLINEEIAAKGKELGADAQITKPEIAKLADVIKSLIG